MHEKNTKILEVIYHIGVMKQFYTCIDDVIDNNIIIVPNIFYVNMKGVKVGVLY